MTAETMQMADPWAVPFSEPQIDPPELELSPLGELESGPSEQVPDRPRDQDFSGLGDGQDSRRLVDGDPAHFVPLELDLTGMDAGPGSEPVR